jgi:hypothetical protein
MHPYYTLIKSAGRLLSSSSLLLAAALQAQAASSYTDASGDLGVGTFGHLDILGMQVSNTATDITFSLTVAGDIGATDWGKYTIGIATGATGTTSGNGWGRPIGLDSPIGGMSHWLASWVDSGGGAEIYSYSGAEWVRNGATWSSNFPGTFVFTPLASSVVSFTVPLASLGLSVGSLFYFDAYTTGGGGTDSAVDALSNPLTSISDWGNSYTSNTVTGLSSYTVIPEPSTYAALLGLGVLGLVVWRRRRSAC